MFTKLLYSIISIYFFLSLYIFTLLYSFRPNYSAFFVSFHLSFFFPFYSYSFSVPSFLLTHYLLFVPSLLIRLVRSVSW